MAIYGAFSIPTLGMMSQSYALNVIGNNVANVNTGGYKETEVHFRSVFSQSFFQQHDTGGVRPKDYQRIDKQGIMVASDSILDLAINGHGFFNLNSEADGSGSVLYGRDGAMQIRLGEEVDVTADDGSTITVREGFLADKNGFFVQGWAPDAQTHEFADTGTLQSLRVDAYAFVEDFQPTTEAQLTLNLPALDEDGDLETYAIDVIDSDGSRKSAILNFTKGATPNEWTITVTTGNAGDVVTSAATTITFNPDGRLDSTTAPYTVAVTWDNSTDPASTSSVELDITQIVQFAGDFTPVSYTRGGFGKANLRSFSFDSLGHVVGAFEDGTNRRIYKIPLAQFANPDGLEMKNGNTFAESELSGEVRIVPASTGGYASFAPNTREMSNVDIADQFTRMMLTQTAYNASSTVFKTIDEMTSTARDLKR